jgi:hypothetical protein
MRSSPGAVRITRDIFLVSRASTIEHHGGDMDRLARNWHIALEWKDRWRWPPAKVLIGESAESCAMRPRPGSGGWPAKKQPNGCIAALAKSVPSRRRVLFG